MNGAQGSGGGQQRIGEEQAQHGKQAQGLLQRAALFIGKGSLLVRNIGADADHVGLKLLQKTQVCQ